MNVPKLRFNEFNTEWNEIILDELIEEKNLKTGNISKYPLWSLTLEDGVTPKTDRYERKFLVKKENNYKIVEPQDYVYNPMNAHLGAIARNKSNNYISVSGYYNVFKINLNNYGFFDNYFISPCMFKKYKLISTGSLLEKQRVHYSQFRELKIKIPSNHEMEKISCIFELLNKRIELQSKKIEDLKLYKKGLLLNYFKGKKTNKIIKDIIKYGKAGGTPKSSVKEYYNGKIPFLSISDMTKQGKYIYNTERNISEIGLKNSSAWLVPEDSIILSMYASYGLVAINKIKLSTSQAMFNMILNDNVFVEYIYQYLNYLNISNYYDKLISTGTQSNLSAEKIYNIKIFIPEFNEQKLIANLLNCIDILIEFNIKKKKNYHKLKKGLMQNMFV